MNGPAASRRPRDSRGRRDGWLRQFVPALDHRPKLDSICGATQTRAKDEIQAIPRQNQAAVSEARDKVMRETIPALRAAPSPRCVYWPYEGRAFPLIEKLFNEYPHMAQPPEEWLPLQIQQTPGLDKCIFPI
jgi:hypothetical protein